MKVDASTVDEFFAAAGEREPELRELDKLIRSTAPSLKRQLHGGMSITMLGYGMFDYKTKSGRSGTWPVVSIAPQKNYMSLYVCAARDGKYLAEIYQDKLGKVSCGKSCIRFKKIEDLNLKTVTTILREVGQRIQQDENPFEFFTL